MSSPLLKTVQRQIIPWTEQFGLSKIILARPSWREMQAFSELSQDVSILRKPLRSNREAVKGRRQYGNAALIDARWPKDHLQSCRAVMLQYVLSGAVTLPFADYTISCWPGYGVLIPAGVPNSDGTHLFLNETVANNTSCRLLMIRPYNGGAECWLSHTRDGEHWSHRTSEESCRIPNRRICSYMETLAEEMMQRKMRHAEVSSALLRAIVNLLFRELSAESMLLPALSSINTQRTIAANIDPIAQAIDFINEHLSEHLTLNYVARHIYMSERSFSQRFRQATKQSFVEYLTDRRFEKALNLLKNTDWSIEQISHFVGVKQGRLRALFHQRVGIAPTHYKQQLIDSH